MASARTFTELFLALFVLGFGYANLDITSNTVAVEVENLVDRKWMVSFHGCWSTGAFATTVLGGSIAHFVEPRENLIGVALISILFFIPLSRYMLPPDLDNHKGDHEDSSAKIPLFGKKTAPLWWMGFGMLGGMIAAHFFSKTAWVSVRDSTLQHLHPFPLP